MGRGRTVTVIMWREDEDHIILGVTTLESFGLEVGLVKGNAERSGASTSRNFVSLLIFLKLKQLVSKLFRMLGQSLSESIL